MRRLAIGVTVSVGLLVGCGGSPDPVGSAHTPPARSTFTPKYTPVAPFGPGRWKFTSKGAVGIAQIPTPATDPRVKQLEAYRLLTGTPPVTYIAVDIDNTRGKENVLFEGGFVVESGGSQWEALGVHSELDVWLERFAGHSRRDITINNKGVDIINAVKPLVPGAKGTQVLMVDTLIHSPTRIYFVDYLYNQIPAYRIGS